MGTAAKVSHLRSINKRLTAHLELLIVVLGQLTTAFARLRARCTQFPAAASAVVHPVVSASDRVSAHDVRGWRRGRPASNDVKYPLSFEEHLLTAPTAAPTAEHPRLDSARTMGDLMLATAAAYPARVAVRSHGDGTEWTYAQVMARVGACASRLQQLGVRRGTPVALMLRNRPEFHVVDAAAMLLGAVPFSVYYTSSREQVEFILTNAGAHLVVTESAFVPVLREAHKLGASLETLLTVDVPVDGCADLLLELACEDSSFDLRHAADDISPDDLLTLIYTSGTTGPPKGVELTHGGMVTQLRAVHEAMPLPGNGRQISFLPAAHVADRWTSHYSALMTYGNTVVTVDDPTLLPAAVAQTRPTLFGAVPRVWEKFKVAVEAAYPGDLLADVAARPELGHALLERLGLDQTVWAMSGAAPTPTAVTEFFTALGLPLCEALGMSETTCCVSITTPDDVRPGSVGRPLPSVELSLATDGELLIRSAQVMRGYRGLPAQTAEAVDGDGWLHAGDVARIDDDGFLWIVDRKKELIISAGGKNMSPTTIEMAVRSAGSLVGHVCVIGDARPYNVALIVLDPAAIGQRDPDDPDVRHQVGEQVARANSTLARVEQIKKFAILPHDWLPGQELTPTMKLRRRVISDRYAAEIQALYDTA